MSYLLFRIYSGLYCTEYKHYGNQDWQNKQKNERNQDEKLRCHSNISRNYKRLLGVAALPAVAIILSIILQIIDVTRPSP